MSETIKRVIAAIMDELGPERVVMIYGSGEDNQVVFAGIEDHELIDLLEDVYDTLVTPDDSNTVN